MKKLVYSLLLVMVMMSITASFNASAEENKGVNEKESRSILKERKAEIDSFWNENGSMYMKLQTFNLDYSDLTSEDKAELTKYKNTVVEELKDLNDKHDRNTLILYISLVVGGLLLATGLALLTTPKHLRGIK